MHRFSRVFFLCFLPLLAAFITYSCSDSQRSRYTSSPGDSTNSEDVPGYIYNVINTYPHDPNGYTQGLVFEDSLLYEGTGGWGVSSLRKVELESGNVLQIRVLPRYYFGEGITIYEDKIIQLTWRAGTGLVYDKESFDSLDAFHYTTEGWGITYDGTHLIMSDGTSTLHFLDPETFKKVDSVEVLYHDVPVTRLNELECVQGEIYSNVWETDSIAMISPQTGQVVGWIELGGLLSLEDRIQPVGVLNGIAYDPENDRLFVTGKYWPKLFEIELIPVQ